MRVRSHQNPFSLYQEQTKIDLTQIFSNSANPLILEIGSAGGKFILDFCKQYPGYNILGIEIRKLLVDHVNQTIQNEKITNAHVIHANANTAITQIFQASQLDMAFIFFPDPWIKKRHLKRRLVNQKLVTDLHYILKPDGEVFIQSDVLELATDIQSNFEANSGFKNLFGKNHFAVNNFTGVITERESFSIEDNTPVHRLRYQKLH